MSSGNISGYQGATGVAAVIQGASGEEFILVYNGTASTVYTNGDAYNVSFANDATGVYPILATPATDSVGTTVVGIVNNTPLGSTTIAAGAWGYVQVAGYCEAITGDGSAITIGHGLKCGNSAIVATDEGTATLTAKSFAIAKTTGAASAGVQVAGWLLGWRVTV